MTFNALETFTRQHIQQIHEYTHKQQHTCNKSAYTYCFHNSLNLCIIRWHVLLLGDCCCQLLALPCYQWLRLSLAWWTSRQPTGPDDDQMRINRVPGNGAASAAGLLLWLKYSHSPNKRVLYAYACTNMLIPLHSRKQRFSLVLHWSSHNLPIIFYPSLLYLCSTVMQSRAMWEEVDGALTWSWTHTNSVNHHLGFSQTSVVTCCVVNLVPQPLYNFMPPAQGPVHSTAGIVLCYSVTWNKTHGFLDVNKLELAESF